MLNQKVSEFVNAITRIKRIMYCMVRFEFEITLGMVVSEVNY